MTRPYPFRVGADTLGDPMVPQTLPEWQAYINTLSGHALYSKALAANTLGFVRMLGTEGMTPSDITEILRTFALRLNADGQGFPSKADGTYLDYGLLIQPGLPSDAVV